MNRIAFATLARELPRARQCGVELVEFDLPARVGSDAAARYGVTVRQGPAGGEMQESSLTALPCTLPEARRRALDFITRRLAAGDRLLRQQGFDELATAAAAAIEPVTAAAPEPAPDVPPAIAALLARLAPDRWKLLNASARARTAWRIGECSDAGSDSAAQQALYRTVPRLVDLLGSGKDLLDLCLAVAIGRLRDPGAAPALRELSTRGRSPATKRIAREAWLLSLPPDALAAQLAGLRDAWGPLVARVDDDSLPAQAEAALAERAVGWPKLLGDWYELALIDPAAHVSLRQLLAVLPLQHGPFQGLRYVYKAAELRRDAPTLAVLHARFENARPGEQAFRTPTRDYLCLRGWRTLRRLAAIDHPHAASLAVQLLLRLDDRDLPAARQEARSEYIDGRLEGLTRHYPPQAHWMLVRHLLVAVWPGLHASRRGGRWWTEQAIDCSAAPAERSDGLRAMWDAHPRALLALALDARSALVHAVVARALQDHAAFVQAQDACVLRRLLQSAWAPTAALGFRAVRARVETAASPAQQVPWLVLLADSADRAAQDFALLHIAADPAAFAQHAALVTALLLSPQARARKQGQGLALLAAPGPLLAELQAALLAVDGERPELAQACLALCDLLEGHWAGHAGSVGAEQLLSLLEHASSSVVAVGAVWLLRHPFGLLAVPPALLAGLLAADDAERRASGARLLAALPDDVLRGQVALIAELALHPHAGIREAIAPAIARLAPLDAAFAGALADRLHAALFASETGDGVHDNALHWLTTTLAAQAPARDASGAWRALQARSPGAQRYGAWALAQLQASDFSLRQQATLARHADVAVRGFAMRAIDNWFETWLTADATPPPDQTEQLLPLADAVFDDARGYAQQLFGERLPDASLGTELLIAWIDHPQPWVQALGRSRLVRRMSAADASLCLTRLSQHPSAQVQLFVTQWLLELPTDEPLQLAQRLRGLKPYFLAVLSQVHRGRIAKTRVTQFLRGLTEAPETAAVVAEIFARQVVSASLTDKPQYIAGLRDIAARHPDIELPCIAWTPPAARAASASSGT